MQNKFENVNSLKKYRFLDLSCKSLVMEDFPKYHSFGMMDEMGQFVHHQGWNIHVIVVVKMAKNHLQNKTSHVL